jgi:hypothetical protein
MLIGESQAQLQERTRVERVLAHGVLDEEHARVLANDGFNGDLRLDRFVLAGQGAADAVMKLPHQQAAQEAFEYGLSREIGAAHLFAPVALRADHSAATAFIAGTEFGKAGVTNVATLEAALRRGAAARSGAVEGAALVQHTARVERQLLQYLDWLVANDDRHVRNGMVANDAATGVQMIDHGAAGVGDLAPGRVRPFLRVDFQGDVGRTGRWRGLERTVLEPDALTAIRQLDADTIRRVHAETVGAVPKPVGGGPFTSLTHRYTSSARYLENVLRRHEFATTRGFFEYVAPPGRFTFEREYLAITRLGKRIASILR